MKRAVVIIAILLVAAGAAAPFFPLDFLKPRIASVLSAGLGRRVEIETVYLTLFSGPGFSLEGVTIHEDPRAGREPFAYATTLDARVDLLGLLQGRRGFSLLNFGDATFNLVKNGDQPWNVQMLMDAGATSKQLPAIRIRAGRVNVKIKDTKSTLFFDDVDLDVTQGQNRSVSVRFSGVPSRTDRSGLDFGHFFVRGTYSAATEGPLVDMTAQVEPSSLDAIARLFGQNSIDWQGWAAGDARISGSLNALVINGNMRLTDSRRGDLIRFGYKGTVDVVHPKLDLMTDNTKPVHVRYSATNLFTSPVWESSVALQAAPLADIAAALRKVGLPVPEKLAVQGSMDGTASYSSANGFSGQVDMHNGTLALGGPKNAEISPVHVTFTQQLISLQPVTVTTESMESARLEGSFSVADGAIHDARKDTGLDLRVTTRAFPGPGLNALGIMGLPLPDGLAKGTIRGAMRLREAAWTGDYELQDAEVLVDGLAGPVKLATLTVRSTPGKIVASRMKGSVENLSFEGEYQRSSVAGSRDQLRLVVTGGSAEELERIFWPVLVRDRGFIQRTLRLGSETAAPDWITQRKLEGTVAVRGMDVAGHAVNVETGHLLWEGTTVSLSGIEAKVNGVRWSGELRVDLTGTAPIYRFEGTMQGLPLNGGLAELEGKGQASGVGTALLGGLHAEGALKGKFIRLAPDAEFRTASGRFTLDVPGGSPRWKFTELELTKGGETLTGEGSLQGDGKISLDLTSDGKPVKITGSLGGNTKAGDR